MKISTNEIADVYWGMKSAMHADGEDKYFMESPISTFITPNLNKTSLLNSSTIRKFKLECIEAASV